MRELKWDFEVDKLLFIACGFGELVEFRCLKFTGNPNTGKFKLSSGNICTGAHQLIKWAELHFWSFLEKVFQAQLYVNGVRYSELSQV